MNVADFFENFQLEIVFLGILVASEVTFFELEGQTGDRSRTGDRYLGGDLTRGGGGLSLGGEPL